MSDSGMSAMEFFRKAYPLIVTKTGNPMDPIYLQEAYKHVKLVGIMLTHFTTQEEAEKYMDLLLYKWNDKPDFMEEDAKHPAFVLALASVFNTALSSWIRDLVEKG